MHQRLMQLLVSAFEVCKVHIISRLASLGIRSSKEFYCIQVFKSFVCGPCLSKT